MLNYQRVNVCRLSAIRLVVFRISQPSMVSQISLNIGIFWHFLKKKQADGGHKTISDGSMVPDL